MTSDQLRLIRSLSILRRLQVGSADRESELRNYKVVLTNPDTFHYLMQMYYLRVGKQSDAPDEVFSPLIHKFHQFTFDEFHIFETPQIGSVLNALLLIFETAKGQKRKFLFQSATPTPSHCNIVASSAVGVQQLFGEWIPANL